jgi:hypothetical protein
MCEMVSPAEQVTRVAAQCRRGQWTGGYPSRLTALNWSRQNVSQHKEQPICPPEPPSQFNDPTAISTRFIYTSTARFWFKCQKHHGQARHVRSPQFAGFFVSLNPAAP